MFGVEDMNDSIVRNKSVVDNIYYKYIYRAEV